MPLEYMRILIGECRNTNQKPKKSNSEHRNMTISNEVRYGTKISFAKHMSNSCVFFQLRTRKYSGRCYNSLQEATRNENPVVISSIFHPRAVSTWKIAFQVNDLDTFIFGWKYATNEFGDEDGNRKVSGLIDFIRLASLVL